MSDRKVILELRQAEMNLLNLGLGLAMGHVASTGAPFPELYKHLQDLVNTINVQTYWAVNKEKSE